MPRFLCFLLLLAALPLHAQDIETASPGGNIVTLIRCPQGNAPGQPTLSIRCDGQTLFEGITLGLLTDRYNLSDSLLLAAAPQPTLHTDDYSMPTGKRAHCHNQAYRRTLLFRNPQGRSLGVELRVYDDGVAFRYRVDEALPGEQLTADATTYPLAAGKRRWMHDKIEGNEGFYPLATAVTQSGERRGYPALMEPADSLFALITEANLQHGHCGAFLTASAPDRYRVQWVNPTLPLTPGWTSPWHLLIMGSAADVVESTLVTDVADPCCLSDTSWIKPAPASWIYWAYNHGTRDYQKLKAYVDLAADMGWTYSLIDWEWNEMGNGGTVEDIFSYARSRDVKPLLWYNSSTAWTGEGAPRPLYRLNTPESRAQEFKWLQEQGVCGVKIDFFPCDSARIIDYYLDLLQDAARYRLMVNFHGGTLPWGWQRTYPHLVSLEAVYGAEWYNNNGTLTDRAARHNATLPFTRNVIGSMDYTPGTFSDSQHKHLTTHAHELALTVLFESGIQHMPDRPEVYRSLPEAVRRVLAALPTAWDDTRLLSGYPGESIILARRKGSKWYVAGINGRDTTATLTCSLQRLGLHKGVTGTLFGDSNGDPHSFCIQPDWTPAEDRLEVDCNPRGGFLLVIE